ncbi:MAG TPA: allantoicase [Thermoanaerobaculia bacterium]
MSFRDLIDLASERLGGSVVYANDEFFADKGNLLKETAPVWKEHEYTDRGKWMDGWESRRKRTAGSDFALIRLGLPGIVRSVVVDTSFFRGNYPEACSIEATSMRSDAGVDALLSAQWRELLPRSPLEGDSRNTFEIASNDAVSHLRFQIYPDGGVARLRVHGEVVPDWRLSGGLASELDLASIEHGAGVLACSDMFFGPKNNLIMPGRSQNMSGGWETRRRRGPGHDWVVIRLATEGQVRRIEIDTNHFKGNYPDTASLEGSVDGLTWVELLPRTKLQPHTRHFFIDELLESGPLTHVRLNVYPDGGVSRLRVWGIATEQGRRAAVVSHVNALFDFSRLQQICPAHEWVHTLAAERPYGSWDQLVETANRAWFALNDAARMTAYESHARIGERAAGRWSAQEQSGTRGASEELAQALAEANRAYEAKFGFIYLVCATGKSGDDLLADVRTRLANDRQTELRIAAEEQAKIIALRLEKLVL